MRHIAAELMARSDEGEVQARVTFEGFFDGAGKYLREGQVRVVAPGTPVRTTWAAWWCKPEVRRGFSFATKPSEHAGWMEIGG